MLINAILMKFNSLPPERILRGILLLCGALGFICSIIPPFVSQILDHLPRNRLRNQIRLNAEIQHKYEVLCTMLVEERVAREKTEKMNTELRRLNEERLTFDRYHDSRARAAMSGKPQ